MSLPEFGKRKASVYICIESSDHDGYCSEYDEEIQEKVSCTYEKIYKYIVISMPKEFDDSEKYEENDDTEIDMNHYEYNWKKIVKHFYQHDLKCYNGKYASGVCLLDPESEQNDLHRHQIRITVKSIKMLEVF